MNIIRPFLLISVVSILVFSSCAPSRLVRPLEKHQHVVNAEIGGPLFAYAGTTIPVPLTSFMYGYGVTDNTSVFGSFHTTSLLFGVLQTDIGACQRLYYNDSLRLGISATPALNLAQQIVFGNSFKCWPQVDVNFYWDIKPKKSFVYAGVENWFELAGQRAEEQTQTTHWIYCPQVGYTYVRTKWNYNLEVKYIAPNIPNLPNVVSYLGIGGNGALAVYFSITRKF